MAIVKPFKGVRPKKEFVEKVACPPYDVMDRDEAKEMVKGNPYSFLHITRAEVDFPDNVDEHDEKVYEKANDNLQNFLKQGILFQDNKPVFYIYKQNWKGHSQTGIVAVTSCEEYDKGIIRKHEFTRKDKEEDRTKNILITKANTGPVFLTYRDHEEIVKFIDDVIKNLEPEYDITDEKDVEHIFYVLKDDQLINKMEKYFQNVDILFIADGHHRSASATNVWKIKKQQNKNHTGTEDYNFFLSVIFPAEQLRILPYNRVVKDLNNLSNEEFINKLKNIFNIEQNGKKEPEKKHEICMYLDNKWYTLSVKNKYISDDPVDSLDVAILQNNVLDKILSISNPRTDKRVKFVGGIRGVSELENLVNSGNFKVAFSMFPTSIHDLIEVAAANKIMPPKSTWFEPKLRSGLVIHKLEDWLKKMFF